MIETDSEGQGLLHLASGLGPWVEKEGRREGMPGSWAETT